MNDSNLRIEQRVEQLETQVSKINVLVNILVKGYTALSTSFQALPKEIKALEELMEKTNEKLDELIDDRKGGDDWKT